MKAVMLMNAKGRENVFAPEDIARMKARYTLDDSDTDLSADITRVRIKDADIIITTWGSPKIDAQILAGANPKLVIHAAGSVKGIVSDALWDAGARVSSAACALGKGVAETTLGLTIMALKDIPVLARGTAEGGWKGLSANVKEVFRVTIGIISAGFVGRHYAKLLQMFDVNVLLYDPYITEEDARALRTTKVTLEDLLEKSDVVSIHAPSIDATKHMINAKTLEMMKKDAILINTARGSIVDEAALEAHMQAGNLRYACIDVTDPEPPAEDHPLRKMPNVIMTPHIAGLVNNGLKRIGAHVADEMDAFATGQPLAGEVLREQLDKMA